MQKDRLQVKDNVAVDMLASSPIVALKTLDGGVLENFRKQLRYIGSKGINVEVSMKQVVDELNSRESNA